MHPKHEPFARALERIWPELPALVEGRWTDLEPRLAGLRARLTAERDQAGAIVAQILRALQEHPRAYQRFVELLAEEQPAESRRGTPPASRSAKLPEMPAFSIPPPAPLAPPSAPNPPAAPAEAARYESIPVFYATDRALTNRAEPSRVFGSDRGALSFGVATVSVPRDHRIGELEHPKWWKLEFRSDPEKHVTLLSVEPLERDAFVRRATETVSGSAAPEALIFVHGYKVSFEDAARRTAQISYDLSFKGLPLMYTWPSEARFLQYAVDETNARWTVPHFRDFLQLALLELGVQTVHIIAHSMGNRVVTEALSGLDMTALGPGAAELEQIVFAAPDIDAATFKDLTREFRGRAKRFTLYSSSNDKALEASRRFHKYPRAGDAADGLVVVEGVDTVDASAVDTSFLGHSYIGDNDSILADVHDLIRDGSPPDARFRLRPTDSGEGRYWLFRP